ncbi:MAG TPA: hypothetical protein VGL55_13475 [Steroidobacteraceae bacterium]
MVAAAGAIGLLGMARGTSYRALSIQLVALGAGVLNATRQTGSVLGVALFGSLLGRGGSFLSGAHVSVAISAALLVIAAGAILSGSQVRKARVPA